MSNLPVVDDYMTRTLIQFAPDENIHAAAKTLLEKRISGAPVVNEAGELVGCIVEKGLPAGSLQCQLPQGLGWSG